ncbi:ATP-binding cassette domain-containing protein [Cohnella faecalis]|uniref:ATP-binding cassette domain-containing protein n=1 Tax=Cohnella faecalis TaxID=2315694 RepID=A0A398CEQ4_9BACL|nr:ATP-binding cassette domain-containing protein [Cohnella faecalis]RIE00342.1 ATP-binding cassette domain-containing protein [Cohnella faecalis]
MIPVIRFIFACMKPYKKLAMFFFSMQLLDFAFVSLAPLSFKVIIDRAIEPKDMDAFVLILSVLGISGLICLSAGVVSDFVFAKLNALAQKDLRTKLFVHMQQTNIGFFQRTRAGELLSYFSVDAPSIERAMSIILTTGLQSLFVVAVSTIALFYLQWTMALAILVGASAIFIGPYLLGGKARSVHSSFMDQIGLLTGDLQENIKGQKVIRGFNLQRSMTDKFAGRLQALFAIHYRKNAITAQLERIPMISLLLINLTIIGLGSYLALQGHITIGSLVAFFTMYTSMGNSVFNLTFTIPVFADASVSIDRMKQLLDEPKEANGSLRAELWTDKPPEIRFEGVSFRYSEERDILQQIKLDIPSGATAAFVGSSGSGKSTLVQLLLGFYEPNEGRIDINGKRLQDMDRGSFRDRIGVVFQDNFLFNGTIMDNIRMSKPEASAEEVVAAAKEAEIHDYIAGLPDGYDSPVLDEGSNFSGGQRQRIAIARAILRNPPLLLLDEATSALDPISEASINRTFDKLAKDRTVVTVTHRLSSIQGVDRIFVFDQGRLVDSGTHRDMLEAGGYYKRLWEKQSGLTVSSNGQDAEIDEERLSRLPFFEGVDEAVLREIKTLFHTETFSAGQPVIHAGEHGEKFYLIARGQVEVTRRDSASPEGRVRLAVLEDGDHFGEIALLDNVPRTAGVTALTSCVLLVMQRKGLYYVLSNYPEIDARVRRTLKERTK